MAWSKEIRAKLGLTQAALLRQLTKSDGRLALAGSELTEEEIEEAVSICRPDPDQPNTQARVVLYDPTRRNWLIAAWLLGASWRQLASLHNIAYPTVMQSARKGMTPDMTRFSTQMKYEKLVQLRQIYLNNKASFALMNPTDVAVRLDELGSMEDPSE